jgi:hypothetical protein
MRALIDRVVYPRLASSILIGVVLFVLSAVFIAFAATIHQGFFVVAVILKYLGITLFVIGGFYYLMYWIVDYGPDYFRKWLT